MRMQPLWVVVVAVALLATGTVCAQDAPGSPLTIASITTAIGSDADARGIFSLVFAHVFQRGSPRKEFLLSSQLRREWLPAVDRVDFVLLAETEAATLISKCGRYWMVSRVERSGTVVSLRLSERCGGTLLGYVVSLDGREWRLGPPGTGQNGGGWVPGIGSGFAGRPPGCPCL
jgi:hypothetical protein